MKPHIKPLPPRDDGDWWQVTIDGKAEVIRTSWLASRVFGSKWNALAEEISPQGQ